MPIMPQKNASFDNLIAGFHESTSKSLTKLFMKIDDNTLIEVKDTNNEEIAI